MLELKHIGLTVQDEQTGNKKTLLKDISYTMQSGKFLVITGPNGGGKSTLAKIIMGIEKPTKGKVLFQGKDISGLSIEERARLGIGFAFQQPVRFKGLQVNDLLRLAAGKEISIKEACNYLSRVGLCAADYIHRELSDSLSGGEMKRIEIAMLLARKASLSIFDEPEAGIDLWSFHNLITIFQELRERTSGSIIIISHQERILEIADEILVLKQGELTASGTKDQILPSLLDNIDICEFYRRSTLS